MIGFFKKNLCVLCELCGELRVLKQLLIIFSSWIFVWGASCLRGLISTPKTI